MKVGTPGFVGKRLREAREAYGFTASAMTEWLGVTRQAISQYENGSSSPSPEVLDIICSKFPLKRQFFFREPLNGDDCPIMYRSMTAATKFARSKAEQKFAWFKEVAIYLRRFVVFPTVNLPNIDAPADPRELSDDQIEDAAQLARRHWNLQDGPISNVSWLLENNGILIANHDLNARTLDAFSQWSTVLDAPCVVLGVDKHSAARSRFDAAHELAHLLLHRTASKTVLNRKDVYSLVESQAHKFAAAFLLPAAQFATELRRPTLDAMRELKLRWKVSIGAMIMRAGDLELISEDATARLFINRTQRGWRTTEPHDDILEPERPRLFQRSFEAIFSNKVLTPDCVENDLGFTSKVIESLCGLPEGFFDGEDNKEDEPQLLRFPRIA
jgi:Zn-dependent peptidase ImmA (M78 family)/DNA-binding XRE family transcriptional regulator